ncbi:MAG: TatD family hydrolase [Desulfatiglandaceae bacterium]|jgi:TatD DNase family protein
MLIDTHAHLDMEDFENDLEETLARAIGCGISRIVTVGIDRQTSEAALEIAKQHPQIIAGVGIHPHNAAPCPESELATLAELTSHPEVVAWGEIGLDFFRRYASPDDQLSLFKRQLEMARDLELPVIIHDRNAHEEVLELLKFMGPGERMGVIHCFSGDVDLAKDFMALGYYISIPGTVTYKNALQAKEVASKIPLERLLIETDAPFLAPVPHRGKRNEPAFVALTAGEIARLRQMDLEDLGRMTAENARDLFGLGDLS